MKVIHNSYLFIGWLSVCLFSFFLSFFLSFLHSPRFLLITRLFVNIHMNQMEVQTTVYTTNMIYAWDNIWTAQNHTHFPPPPWHLTYKNIMNTLVKREILSRTLSWLFICLFISSFVYFFFFTSLVCSINIKTMPSPGVEPGLPKPQSGVLPLYYKGLHI